MIGKTLGHYQITEKLGEGGMGVVYKAQDLHLNRFVALKILPPEKVADPERKRRFVQEAKAASALNHPNIVHVYDIDQSIGTDYIAMEYVAGKTLDQRIGYRGLRLNDTLKYAVQIADALAKAHSAGIVHRDLKPTNIMVNEDGVVKVLDFGLAKLTEQVQGDETASTATIDSEGRPITEEGVIVGTVSYMSPEQAEGKKIDARSDIFSLGSVLHEMVTGQKAFQGTSKLSTLSAIPHQEPKPVSGITPTIPSDLEKLINRCLRKDPAKRFQHMDDVKVALDELKEDSDSGLAKAVPVRRHGWFWPAMISAAVMAGAAILFSSGPALWAGGLRALWEIDPRQPGAARRLPFTGEQSVASLAVSPRGDRLAYARQLRDENVWRVPLGLSDDTAPAPEAVRVISSTYIDHNARYSPDGSRIVFVSSRSGSLEVWICKSDGSEQAKLTDMGAPVTGSPRWSPDGERIVFDSNVEGQFELYAIGRGGGKPMRLTTHPADDAIGSWSLDGRWIYFTSSRTGDFQIWKMNTGSGEVVQVTQQGGRVPMESPDGTSVYYAKSMGQTSLWRVPAQGGNETQTIGTINWQQFDVVDDGVYFISTSGPEQGSSIEFCSSATLTTRSIARIEGPLSFGLSVSPNRHSALITKVEDRGSDLMLVENFR